jgi:uncharacterized protein with PIN domain
MKEMRILHLRQMARRDFKEGRPMAIPDFVKDRDEQAAYVAAYLGEKHRNDPVLEKCQDCNNP